MRCYSAALELCPEGPAAAACYSNRSAAALMAGDYRAAAADGRRAGELGHERGLARAAKALAAMGRFEEVGAVRVVLGWVGLGWCDLLVGRTRGMGPSRAWHRSRKSLAGLRVTVD